MKLKFKKTPVLDNCTLPEALGLTKERAETLNLLTYKYAQKDPFLLEALPELLEECQTIEEYSYICVAIGVNLHANSSIKPNKD
jgi:hypothetical protein